MSFTFKSRLGKLKMGSTTTITEIDTSSSLNFESLKITTDLILNYAVAGILHTDGNGSVTSRLLDTTDIAPLAVTSEKLQDSIFLSGVPTTTTADADDSSVRIATTEFVQNTINNVLGTAPGALNTLKELADAIGNDADFIGTIKTDIEGKVSLNDDESIDGTKTFLKLPILSSLTEGGIVHNNSDGILSTDLIKTADIADEAVTSSKLATNLVLPFNTTLKPLDEGDSYVTQSLVTVGLLTSNKPLPSPQEFFHINESDTTLGPNGNPIYTLGAYTKYIIETAAKIYLPLITHEGMYFSITNKSGDPIQIITNNTDEEKMYNFHLAPYDGDEELEIDNHRTFDVISQITRNERSWQARFF